MSQNFPFVFGAGGGQPPPVPQPQQHDQNQSPQNLLPQPQNQSAMAQQAAFQQNGQLSGMDMSALDGISPHQLAAIARLFQSGALLPPPPELSAPASTAAQGQAPAFQEPQRVQASIQEQDVDMDKDEGEIDEDEAENVKDERGFLHPPPTGPRNPNVKQRGPQLSQRKPSPRPPVPDNKRKASLPQQPLSSQTAEPQQRQPKDEKDIEAKSFVLALLKAGYSFEDLVKETGNPKALVRLFNQLRLDVPSEFVANSPKQTNGDVASKPAAKSAPPPKAPPPAPAKPLDRSEYLARLQAAKNKKAEVTSSAPTAETASDKAVEAPKQDMEGAQASKPQVEAPKAKPKTQDKTALARQRLEALKAAQAAKQISAANPPIPASKSSPVPKPVLPATTNRQSLSSPSHAGLGAGLEAVNSNISGTASFVQPTTMHQPQETAPPPPVRDVPPAAPARSLSGLPGLYMFDQGQSAPSKEGLQSTTKPHSSTAFPSSVQQPTSQAGLINPPAPTVASNIPRKRPVAMDFDPYATKPKRPFGLSRGNSAEESVIITISDDEDDDADDEMDTDSGVPVKPATTSFREAAPLRDHPVRPPFQTQTQTSGQSTPGASTPGGAAYAQRMKDIEKMKRKIAEAEKRRQANGKTPTLPKSGPGPSAIRSDAPSPTPYGSSGSTPKVVDVPLSLETSHDGLMHTGSPMAATQQEKVSAERPMSAATLARHQEKERLKQRLLELQGDEFKDISEAVEAATEDPESTQGLSADHASSLVEVKATPTVEETQMQSGTSEVPKQQLSEEGEMSDDSGSNFYGPDDNEEPQARKRAAGAEAQAVSQISTSGSMTDGEEPLESDQPSAVGVSQLSQPPMKSPIGTPFSGPIQQDSEMAEAEPESSVPNQPVVEDDEEDQSDDMSQGSSFGDSAEGEEDTQDLDAPLMNRQVDTNAGDNAASFATNMDQDDVSDNGDSSAESDDYDPASAVPMDLSSEGEDDEGKNADGMAISGASTTEPATKDDAPDDGLAPELQPPTEQQSGTPEQVRRHPSHDRPRLIGQVGITPQL